MPHDFQPLPGAEGWQISNLPILAAAPLLASLPLFDAAGHACTACQIGAADRISGVSVARAAGGLADDSHAGGSRSARLPAVAAPAAHTAEAHKVFDALAAAGFTGDWREPDVIRVAPVPLYNTFVEVWEFVDGARTVPAMSAGARERSRPGDDRRRGPRRNAARDPACASRPPGAHLRTAAGHAALDHSRRPLDQSRSGGARHPHAGARRRDGSRAVRC